MARMSYNAYAKYRGVSQPAVSKAVRTGRIKGYLDGDKKYVEVEEADRMWPQTAGMTNNISGVAKPKPSPDEPPPPPEPEEDSSEADKAGVPKLYTSKAIREAFLARKAKLDYDVRLGKLVDADEIKKRWTGIVSIARTKFLGVPSKIRQRIPELTNEQYSVIEMIVRESLEELADGGD